MILSLGKNINNEQATGLLVRKDIRTEFRYQTIAPRRFMFNDPIEGVKLVNANTTIKTHADLPFALGDKVILEEQHEHIIVNITRRVSEKQYMLQKRAHSVAYLLDLA